MNHEEEFLDGGSFQTNQTNGNNDSQNIFANTGQGVQFNNMNSNLSNDNNGGFQPSAGAWGFENNGGIQNQDDDLNDEEREKVDKAESEWEDKKRGYFEFS